MNMKVIRSTRKQILEPCALADLGLNYQIDPYLGCAHHCRYCFAQNQPGLDWENEIGVCPDLARKLAQELAPLAPQKIYLGMKTDPYQPLEKEFRQTRAVLELLQARGFSACLLTKSNLVARDLGLLREMPAAAAGISLAFHDDGTRKLFEAGTMPNRDRLEALAELKRNQIETYALICPVLPYLTEVEALINEVCPYADTIWVYPLEMNSEEDANWRKIAPLLQRLGPNKTKKFKEIVFSPRHAYWKQLRRQLESIRKRDRVNLKVRLGGK